MGTEKLLCNRAAARSHFDVCAAKYWMACLPEAASQDWAAIHCAYFCPEPAVSFWYDALSVPFAFAIGNSVG